jgi:hypothetical protein
VTPSANDSAASTDRSKSPSACARRACVTVVPRAGKIHLHLRDQLVEAGLNHIGDVCINPRAVGCVNQSKEFLVPPRHREVLVPAAFCEIGNDATLFGREFTQALIPSLRPGASVCGRLFPVARRERVVSGGNGVAVPDQVVGAMDHRLTAAVPSLARGLGSFETAMQRASVVKSSSDETAFVALCAKSR